MPTTLRALATASDEVGAVAVEACANLTDPDLMFPDIAYAELEEDMPNDCEEAMEAKQVCVGCPVRDLCLEVAVAKREQWGVWGGMTYKEREALRRRLSRRALAARQRRALRNAAPVLATLPASSRVRAWAEQLELFEVGA